MAHHLHPHLCVFHTDMRPSVTPAWRLGVIAHAIIGNDYIPVGFILLGNDGKVPYPIFLHA